jgi:hypothetical protein
MAGCPGQTSLVAIPRVRHLRELARPNSRVPSLRWIGPLQRDDDKLIFEGANISGGKGLYLRHALRSRRGDRSRLVYLGQGSDVAVPQRIRAKGAIHDEPAA